MQLAEMHPRPGRFDPHMHGPFHASQLSMISSYCGSSTGSSADAETFSASSIGSSTNHGSKSESSLSESQSAYSERRDPILLTSVSALVICSSLNAQPMTPRLVCSILQNDMLGTPKQAHHFFLAASRISGRNALSYFPLSIGSSMTLVPCFTGSSFGRRSAVSVVVSAISVVFPPLLSMASAVAPETETEPETEFPEFPEFAAVHFCWSFR